MSKSLRVCQACLIPMPKPAVRREGYGVCRSCAKLPVRQLLEAVHEGGYIEGITPDPAQTPPARWPWHRNK